MPKSWSMCGLSWWPTLVYPDEMQCLWWDHRCHRKEQGAECWRSEFRGIQIWIGATCDQKAKVTIEAWKKNAHWYRIVRKRWHLQRGNDIHMKLIIWTSIILDYKHTCIYTFIYRTYSMFQVFTFSLWGIYFLPSGPCRPWIFARKFRGDRFRKPGTHNS